MSTDLNALLDDIAKRVAREVVALQQAQAQPASKGTAPAEYLTTKESAVLMGMSVSFLEGRRARGLPPKCHYIGTAVRYAKADIEAFVTSRTKGKTK